MLLSCKQLKLFIFHSFLQYGLQMPIALLRADNNLPPWRPGLKEVNFLFLFPVFCCIYELPGPFLFPLLFLFFVAVLPITGQATYF